MSRRKNKQIHVYIIIRHTEKMYNALQDYTYSMEI